MVAICGRRHRGSHRRCPDYFSSSGNQSATGRGSCWCRNCCRASSRHSVAFIRTGMLAEPTGPQQDRRAGRHAHLQPAGDCIPHVLGTGRCTGRNTSMASDCNPRCPDAPVCLCVVQMISNHAPDSALRFELHVRCVRVRLYLHPRSQVSPASPTALQDKADRSSPPRCKGYARSDAVGQDYRSQQW
jgi:hypothetical protein